VKVLFAEDVINILHKLEQVSSEGHVGSLAENLLEALKEEPHVAQTIDNVRATTRAEKKRMAMAKRQKQLDALGMTVCVEMCGIDG
jgi:E3 ubiquitin-protein ligase UBR4